MTEPQFSRRRSLVFALAIVVGFFVLLEGLLRVVGVASPVRPRLILRQIDIDITFPFMRQDPETFWSPQPGFAGEFMQRRVEINSLGLRAPELTVPKPAGRKRVLCFGDSITFGYGLSNEETYPARLGELLADRGIEIVNAGVTGFTSRQVLAYMRRQLPQTQSDMATICIGWNDLTLRQVDDQTYARRLSASLALEGSLDRLYLFRGLKSLYLKVSMRGQAKQPRSVPRVSLEQYRENLTRAVSECRTQHIVPLFIALPCRTRPGSAPLNAAYAQELERLGGELGVPVLDVGDLGMHTTLADNSGDFIDALHFSVEGSRRMARQIAPQLTAAAGLQ
jgi:lysophospholipase L1-like esterase